MPSDPLRRALFDPAEPPLRPLPPEVSDLLLLLDAPPRLGAHLRAVHDVATRLVDWLDRHYPGAVTDRAAVLFGAATHDIGKVEHPGELSGPGAHHEPAGERILLHHGVRADLARFARVHAEWDRPDATLDELVVTLADKVWKGKRVADLERRVVDRLAAMRGEEPWEAFLRLDDALAGIADGADARLAFQVAFPVR